MQKQKTSNKNYFILQFGVWGDGLALCHLERSQIAKKSSKQIFWKATWQMEKDILYRNTRSLRTKVTEALKELRIYQMDIVAIEDLFMQKEQTLHEQLHGCDGFRFWILNVCGFVR